MQKKINRKRKSQKRRRRKKATARGVELGNKKDLKLEVWSTVQWEKLGKMLSALRGEILRNSKKDLPEVSPKNRQPKEVRGFEPLNETSLPNTVAQRLNRVEKVSHNSKENNKGRQKALPIYNNQSKYSNEL